MLSPPQRRDEDIDSTLAQYELQFSPTSDLSSYADDELDHIIEFILSVCNTSPSYPASRSLLILETLFAHEIIHQRFKPTIKNLLRLNLPYYISGSNLQLRTTSLRISLALLQRYPCVQIDDITTDPAIQARILNFVAFDSRSHPEKNFSSSEKQVIIQENTRLSEMEDLVTQMIAVHLEPIYKDIKGIRTEMDELKGKVNVIGSKYDKINQILIDRPLPSPPLEPATPKNSESLSSLRSSVAQLTSQVASFADVSDFKEKIEGEIVKLKKEVAGLSGGKKKRDQSNGLQSDQSNSTRVVTSESNVSLHVISSSRDQSKLIEETVTMPIVQEIMQPVVNPPTKTHDVVVPATVYSTAAVDYTHVSNDVTQLVAELKELKKELIEVKNQVDVIANQPVVLSQNPLSILENRQSKSTNQSHHPRSSSSILSKSEHSPSPALSGRSSPHEPLPPLSFSPVTNQGSVLAPSFAPPLPSPIPDQNSKELDDITKTFDDLSAKVNTMIDDGQFRSKIKKDLTSLTENVKILYSNHHGYDRLFKVYQTDIDQLKQSNQKTLDLSRLFQTRMGVLEDEVSSLGGKVKYMKEYLKKIDTKISQFETQSDQNQMIVDSLSAFRSRVSTVEDCMSLIESKQTEILTSLANISVDVNSLQSKSTEIENLTSLKDQLVDSLNVFSDICGKFENYNDSINLGLAKISEFSSDLKNLTSNFEILNTSVSQISSEVTELANVIESTSINHNELSESLLTLQANQKVVTSALEGTKGLLSSILYSKIEMIGDQSTDNFDRLSTIDWALSSVDFLDNDLLFKNLRLFSESLKPESISSLRRLNLNQSKSINLIVSEIEMISSSEMKYSNSKLTLYLAFLDVFISLDLNMNYFIDAKYIQLLISKFQSCSDSKILILFFSVLRNLLRSDRTIEICINGGLLMIVKRLMSGLEVSDLTNDCLIILKNLSRIENFIPFFIEFGFVNILDEYFRSSLISSFCLRPSLTVSSPNSQNIEEFCENLIIFLRNISFNSDATSSLIQSPLLDFIISIVNLKSNEVLVNSSLSVLKGIAKSYKGQVYLKEKNVFNLLQLKYPMLGKK
ncbi:hypothetical protein RCL1_002599 [Eukaryota sp. TZLM3-RCL]